MGLHQELVILAYSQITDKDRGMGHRNYIGVQNEDGTITSAYCHWGSMWQNENSNIHLLRERYSSEGKARELIALASFNYLKETVELTKGQKQKDAPAEPWTAPRISILNNLAGKDIGIESMFIFNKGSWEIIHNYPPGIYHEYQKWKKDMPAIHPCSKPEAE
jgi:hypothetical protein